MGVKVKINGQPFKKGMRLNGANIIEQLITREITASDLSRQTTKELLAAGKLDSLGGDQVTRLAGFNLAKNVKRARIQEELAVAKYFQILVSNTPMDEEYDYQSTEEKFSESQKEKWKEARAKRSEWTKKYWAANFDTASSKQETLETHRIAREEALAEIRKYDDIAATLEASKEGFRTRIHKPDDDYVRGDWVLEFRGVKYQAFKTSRDSGASVFFDMEDFVTPDDDEAVKRIADVLHNHEGNGIVGGGFKVKNDNPRAAMLEYGGYEAEDGTPKVGRPYGKEHGVKNKHTYQAPKGFYRLTNALWNDIAKDAKSGRYQSYILKWLKTDLSNFNVSDVNSEAVKKLLRKRTVSTDDVQSAKLTPKGKV